MIRPATLDDVAEIARHFDADFHNRIANHPSVKPTLGYNHGHTDLSPLLEHPDAYVLLSDGRGAAAVFEWSAPGVWQGHSMILPESRGKSGIAASKAMCRWMFAEMNARMLWGMTPVHRRAAQAFNRLIGFRADGEITDAANIRCRLFVMER